MQGKLVIAGVAQILQDDVQCGLQGSDRSYLVLIKERDAHICFVKIVVIEEEVEHFIYTGCQPVL